MIKGNIKSKRGFVILFAVTVSAMLLAIALGVSNIALKEINFSTSARNANDAFFAADTGAECALYHDRSDVGAFPIFGTVGEVNCSTNESGSGNGTSASYSFFVTGLGSQGQSCAKVTITKDTTPPIFTTVISKGYNIGDLSCNSSNPNRTERQLDLNY